MSVQEAKSGTTCPDGLTLDENGKCPTTTLAPNQSPPAAQDGGHILVMSNPDGSCPAGSHKFPGSQVCEKDAVPPTSGGGTTTTPASNAPPLTPQQQYEACLKGIGGGIPGNCKPSTSTEQNTAPQQTLTPQQTCKDGSTPDANGICQDGSTPICPGGGGRDLKGACLPPLPPCPNGKVEDSQGNCVSPEDRRGQLIEPPCGQLGYIRVHGICYQGREIPNPGGRSCPPDIPILFEGRCLDKLPVLPGSSTGTGGGFIQMLPVKPDGSIGTSGPVVVYVPVNKDGTCPPGDEPASGGYCRHMIQSTPPAAPPTNTPPVQPQPPQQFAPSQPECVPGFHWDNAQLKCVAG